MKESALCLGLMSGTSMDAIDAALVRVSAQGDELIHHTQSPYPASLRKELLGLLEKYEGGIEQMARLHKAVGEAFAIAGARCLKEAGKKARGRLAVIGSHGQTIFHKPQEGLTWQLGEAAVISAQLGATVVSDFRVADMAAGGEGAPLLPWYHRRLFPKRKGVSVHNLGGISNFTYLGKKADDIFGCDTGPANCLVDPAISRLTNGRETFDKNGRMAAKGKPRAELLEFLGAHPAIRHFREKAPPKSTGRELFSQHLVNECFEIARQHNLSPEDMICTLTHFTAETILEAYERWVKAKKLPLEEIVFCGGGANNSYLLSLVRAGLPKVKVTRLEEHGHSAQALEAQAFAVFGWMALKGKPVSCPAVTGAAYPVVCGKITPALGGDSIRRGKKR